MPVIKRMTSLTKFDNKTHAIAQLRWAKKNNIFIPIHIDDLEKSGISLYISTDNRQITAMTRTVMEDEKEFDSWIEEIRKGNKL